MAAKTSSIWTAHIRPPYRRPVGSVGDQTGGFALIPVWWSGMACRVSCAISHTFAQLTAYCRKRLTPRTEEKPVEIPAVCTPKPDRTPQRERGLFCAAYEMRENPELTQYSSERLEDLLTWFRQNLAIPKKFNRSNSKGALRRNAAGLSWFKEDAGEVLQRSHELIQLLAEQGYSIETIRCERVGYIIYEDCNQVIAEPFQDTPT